MVKKTSSDKADEAPPTLIYRSDDRVKSGFFRPLFILIGQIIRWRWHIMINVRRDFMKVSRGATFGAFWNVVLPLVPLGAYTLLAWARVFPEREGYPAIVYVTTGATLWFLFVDCAVGTMKSVMAKTSMIGQTSYPLIGVVAGQFGEIGFNLAVRLCAVALAVGLLWGAPSWGLVLAPLALLPAIAFFLGLGLVLAVMGSASKDISNIAGVIAAYAIFVSNVIFPVEFAGPLAPISTFNPAAIFIDNMRSVVFYARLESPVSYAIASGAGVLLLIVGARMFYVMEFRIRSYKS
ncbi:hypothetical protein FKB34_05865 [Glycocaulis profundi]|nr:hypothetical protein FKB34_05865 [Glycocaulis profundi]